MIFSIRLGSKNQFVATHVALLLIHQKAVPLGLGIGHLQVFSISF